MSAPPAVVEKKRAVRNLPVDTLRGVACLLLVTMHVVGHDSAAGIQVPDDHVLRWYADAFVYLRMPLFVFLSGFVYAWRPLADLRSYPAFMGKKARRLLVPYLIFVPAVGIAQAVVPGANNPIAIEPVHWLVHSLSPYWFLLATFWMFALVALLDGAGLLERRWQMLALLTAATAVATTIPIYGVSFLQAGNALTLLPFFIAGVAMSRFAWWDVPISLRATYAGVFLLAFALAQLSVLGVVPEINSRTDILGIVVGIAFPVAWLSFRITVRWLAWIGGYSSGIFLVHPFVVAATRVGAGRLGVSGTWMLLIVCSLSGILVSILVVKVMRAVPPGRLALGERWNKQP